MATSNTLRAVLDTNVLLGAQRAVLLMLASENQFRLVWSDFIEEEMRRVMSRLSWPQNGADALLVKIDSIAERTDYLIIEGGNYEEWLNDEDDYSIMATAIAGKVDYLVTNNTKDFPPKKRFAEITIITPDAFLRLF